MLRNLKYYRNFDCFFYKYKYEIRWFYDKIAKKCSSLESGIVNMICDVLQNAKEN